MDIDDAIRSLGCAAACAHDRVDHHHDRVDHAISLSRGAACACKPVIMNQTIMFDHVSSSKIAKSVATLDEMQSNMGQALNGTTLSYHFSPRVKFTRILLLYRVYHFHLITQLPNLKRLLLLCICPLLTNKVPLLTDKSPWLTDKSPPFEEASPSLLMLIVRL